MRFSRQLEGRRLASTLLAALLALFSATAVFAEAEEQTPHALSNRELKQAAYNSLWRLKRTMERDGYYSARVALNVWRSNAIDAGIFNVEEYEQYKRQIYEKSIQSSLRCVESALENSRQLEARICLHTWKTHSEAMDEFDADLYERLLEQLTGLSEDLSE